MFRNELFQKRAGKKFAAISGEIVIDGSDPRLVHSHSVKEAASACVRACATVGVNDTERERAYTSVRE